MTQTPSNDEIVPNGTRVRLSTRTYYGGAMGTVVEYHSDAAPNHFPYDVDLDDYPTYNPIPFNRHEFEVID